MCVCVCVRACHVHIKVNLCLSLSLDSDGKCCCCSSGLGWSHGNCSTLCHIRAVEEVANHVSFPLAIPVMISNPMQT